MCTFVRDIAFITVLRLSVSADETACVDGTCVAEEMGEAELDANLYWLQRCNIERRPWPADMKLLTSSPVPYIVQVPAGRNADLSARMERERLLAEMGEMDCTPSEVGNVRRGIANMRLRDYIEDWMMRKVQRKPELNRYVFGEFGEEWRPFREAYVLPPCSACTVDRDLIFIGLGGLHTGAPWHLHGAAFVEVLHGKKHFAFVPPQDPARDLIDRAIENSSQLFWYLEDRPELERQGFLHNLQECTLQAGELLYFPSFWHHGVLNLDPYTAFVSIFLTNEL